MVSSTQDILPPILYGFLYSGYSAPYTVWFPLLRIFCPLYCMVSFVFPDIHPLYVFLRKFHFSPSEIIAVLSKSLTVCRVISSN